MKTFRQGLLGLLGLLVLPACTELPESDGITTGIWMLGSGHQLRDGVMNACRPMLMEVGVSPNSVTLGRRAFPCETESVTLAWVSLERDGESLSLDGKEMGTLRGQKLEITLPDGAGSISWDMSRKDAPYQESSSFGFFSAKPQLLPSATPVPISVSLSGSEDIPFEGRVHVARLPDASIQYILFSSPSRSTMRSFDFMTGRFRLDPDPNFSGVDQFTFVGISDDVESPEGTVEIKFAPVVDPMQARMTFVSVFEDSTEIIAPDVINLDESGYSVQVVQPPAHGQAVAEGAKIFYKPDPDFNGSDPFTYVADNGSMKSNEGTIHVTVIPVDDPPIAKDVDVQVTSGSATPITLQVVDIDSTDLFFQVLNPPIHGQFVGDALDMIYQSDPGYQGTDSFTYGVWSGSSNSEPATVKITITPGPYVCTLLTTNVSGEIVRQWQEGSKLYYRVSYEGGGSAIGVAGDVGLGSPIVAQQEFDTFGFENSVGGTRRTTFFNLGSMVHFTTTTKAAAVRIYRVPSLLAETLFEIPAPGNDVAGEPSVGEAYVEADATYLPVYWRTANSQYACQLWKIASLATQPELVQAFPLADGPCFGVHTFGAEQYMFVGSNVVKFAGMASSPVIVKDLGNARPTPWMVEAGGKLFFQTRTAVGADTQIDLWVTDGTPVGTKLVKQIETAFFEFDIFSPIAFLDKLYFAHEKSLWSSDGTDAGTNIVTTIPVNSVVGDGAIGTISTIGGRLYFLATSNASGREPWISDGTTAGTTMLRDIQMGVLGSSTASANPMYFHEGNGQVLFLANDGAGACGLWTTDGTPGGTKLLMNRQISTIVGVVGNQLLYQDSTNFFSMALQ